MSRLRPVLVAAGCASAVALLGGSMTTLGPWYYGLRKPSWQPPDWLFGPVWTVIFALCAWAGVLAWTRLPPGRRRLWIMAAFALNAGLNVLWSDLFFAMHRPDWALIEVVPFWLSIVLLAAVLWPVSHAASLAIVPYVIWVGFAGYLNLVIVRLNAPFAA